MKSEKDIAEFRNYLLKQVPADATDEDREEFVKHVFKQEGIEMPQEQSMSDQLLSAAKSAAVGGLDYGLRGLDYAGGMTRTGAAALMGQTQEGDWTKAAQGQAVPTEEFLDRAGIPEGGAMSDLAPSMYSKSGDGIFTFQEGGFMDPNARDAAGFVGDIALDPLTYASLGATAAMKKGGQGLGKMALGGVGRGVEAGGSKLFKSGLKNVDKKLVEMNKKPLSQVLLDNNIGGGSMQKISQKAGQFGEELSTKREVLYSAVDNAGATVDTLKASDPAFEVLAKMYRDPNKKQLANKLEDYVSNYMTDGGVSVRQASEWKTNLYETLPDSAFKATGQMKGDSKKVIKALSQGYEQEIRRAAESVLPGAGEKVSKINTDWGSILSAQKPLSNEVNKATTKNMFTQVDAGLLGAGAMGSPEALGALALKQGAKAANSTSVRTRAGGGLRSLGRSGAVDPVARQTLKQNTQSNYAPVSAWQKSGL